MHFTKLNRTSPYTLHPEHKQRVWSYLFPLAEGSLVVFAEIHAPFHTRIR